MSAVPGMAPIGSYLRYRHPKVAQVVSRIVHGENNSFQLRGKENHLCVLVEFRGSECFEKAPTDRCGFI